MPGRGGCRRGLAVCLLTLLGAGLLGAGQARAAALLDGRGWEMVSPVDKNGGDVQGLGEAGNLLQAAAGGGAVSFGSVTSFAGGAGAPALSEYVARRAGSGWGTANVTLAQRSGAYGEGAGENPYRLFSPDLARALVLDGSSCPAGEPCVRSYSLVEPPGQVAAISPAAPDLTFAGGSPDLRHVVLATCAALTAEAVEEPEGEGCAAADTNLYEWGGGGLTLVNASHGEILPPPFGRLAAPAGSVSEDGRRVYWEQLGGGPIWLHEEGGSPANRALPESAGASFQVASTDGARAFFTAAGTLYRYDAGSGASEPIATGVSGVLGASAAGTVVYYQAADGLYRWSAGTVTKVAAGAGAAAPGDYPPAAGTARVSADGGALLFLSEARLTSYDNTDAASGEPDPEVFLWGERAGLACLSCDPSGAAPRGPSTIPGAIGGGEGATLAYKPRALVAGGRRAFFTSADALVPEDTDNRPDAYEWETGGEGSCAAPGGCLALLSGGRGALGASFADASASGGDAYFLTDESLVPADPDSVDLYDAREGGGFPVPPTPIACEGDSCQPLPSPPEDPLPGTLVSGQGNPPVTYGGVAAGPEKRRVRHRRHSHHHRRHARGHHPRRGRRHRGRGKRGRR